MRQQLADAAIRLRGQPLEHVSQVGVRVMAVEPGRLAQTHHRGRTLPAPERTGEQPVRAPQRDRPDAVLDPVVVDRYGRIVEEPAQRPPALEAVVDRLRHRRAIGRALPVQRQPLVQRVGDRPGS